MIEKNKNNCSIENSYYWLIYDGLKNIISMNPYDYFELKQARIDKKRHFIIDNKQWLCEHGEFHSMIERKGRYIPVNKYNHMKKNYKKLDI